MYVVLGLNTWVGCSMVDEAWSVYLVRSKVVLYGNKWRK